MSYRLQYATAVTATVLLTCWGVVQVADPSISGLSPQALFWGGVIFTGLGVAQGFLPSVRRPPADVDNAGPASNPDPMPRDS